MTLLFYPVRGFLPAGTIEIHASHGWNLITTKVADYGAEVLVECLRMQVPDVLSLVSTLAETHGVWGTPAT